MNGNLPRAPQRAVNHRLCFQWLSLCPKWSAVSCTHPFLCFLSPLFECKEMHADCENIIWILINISAYRVQPPLQQSKRQTIKHTDTRHVRLASHSFETLSFRFSSSFNRIIEAFLCNTTLCTLYLLWILHHLPLVYKAACYITYMNSPFCTLHCCLAAWKFCTTL